MKLLKNKNIGYLLLGFVIVLMLFMTIIKTKSQEQAIEPITYDFYNNSLFDIDQENNPNYYNIHNQTEYLGNYLGSEQTDTLLELDLNDNGGVYSHANERSEYLGHTDIFEFNTTNTADNSGLFRRDSTFTQKSVLDYEFWFNVNDTFSRTRIYFFQDSAIHTSAYTTLYYQIQNNELIIITDATYYIDTNIKNNTWYHLETIINCTSDTIYVYYQGNLIFHGIDLFNNNDFDYTDVIEFYVDDTGQTLFIDGLDGNCYDNYERNENFLPKKENTGYLEVDKFEFDYDYDDFENDFYDWKQIEATSSYNYIQIAGSKDIDKYMRFDMLYGAIYSQELHYIPNSNSMILNISMEYTPDSLSNPYDFQTFFYILPKNYNTSQDGIGFKITGGNDRFRLFNQSYNGYNYKFDIVQDQMIFINIYINYYDDIYIWSIYNGNDFYKFIYDLDINDNNLYGFYDIYFYAYCAEPSNPSSFNSTIDHFGIYENGLSILNRTNTNEFGLMYYEISNSWNSDNHNLLTIDSNNYYDIYVHNYYDYYLDGYSIKRKFNQTKLETINLQDSFDNNYPKFIYNCPYLIFRLFGNCTNFYEIEIEGVQLIDQDNNAVYGNYYINNTDSNYNWFYVVENRLYYNFNNNDTYGLETMRIIFNVYDVLLANQSLISYSSYITNNYTGNIYVDSYYQRETFSISNNNSLVNSYLNMTDTSHFTLTEISIEIQTNGSSNKLAKGFIRNINIYPEKPLFPDFEPIEYLDSTIIEKLLETFIPIIFFILPCLLIRSRFGNKVVIPSWILMTIIFLITNFIPFWIGFIIFLGIGLMALNREKEVLE